MREGYWQPINHQRVEVANEQDNVLEWTAISAGTTGNIRKGVIDLSDITNYPHADTTKIDISKIHMDINVASGTATATFHLGIVQNVATGTRANWFDIFRKRIHNHSAGSVWDEQYRFSQLPGSSETFMVSGSSQHTGTTLFHNSTAFVAPTTAGTFTIAAGDLILYVDVQNGTVQVDKIRLHYHSH